MDYPLFETVAVERGEILNLDYHQMRYEQALHQYYGRKVLPFNLQEILQKSTALLTLKRSEPLIRCRIDYNDQDYRLQCFAYQRKVFRSFQPVICDHINYGLKFSDRRIFAELLRQKGKHDEIIIIKQGLVTDCTIGNLLFRKNQQWFTPEAPLLNGTQRAKLLAEKRIQTLNIKRQDIAQFDEIRLINAMNPFSESL